MHNSKNELTFLELVRQKYYAVFDNGDIYKTFCRFCRRDCFKRVSYRIDKKGYCHIKFSYNRKSLLAAIHRIVYGFFRGKIPDGIQINHIDGNPGNNALSNLEAVTPKENIKHAIYVTRTRKYFGTEHHNARLKPSDIAKIIYFHHRGAYNQKQLSTMFGIDRHHIADIYKFRAWRSLLDKEYILSVANNFGKKRGKQNRSFEQ